jgi:hypothetical protein
MRVMDLSSSGKKRIRGQRRKTKDMVADILRACGSFPQGEEEPGWGFWHTHLPVRQDFIDSPKVPFGLRRLCAQTLIDGATLLAAKKASGDKDTRVVAYINLPALWYSEIVVFFGETHYKDFFSRDNAYQTWIELPGKRDIAREWGLRLPSGFSVRGYKEILRNDEDIYENELWYIGELG